MIVPVGALFGLLIAAVVTYVMPKKYESMATIEVRQFAYAPVVPPGGVEGEAPAWLLMEIEKMKSRPALEKVSDSLELTNRWNLAKDEVPPILNHATLIQSIRGTDLVSIRVRHTNKVDAGDIANEIAKSYKAYRADSDRRHAVRMLHELKKAIRDQEDKVEERRKVLAAIEQTKKNIVVEGKETLLHLTDSQDYIDAQRQFETDQELLQTMNLKLIGEEISTKIPRESVIVHDSPGIAESPVSPNVTLNLVMGTLLGVLSSPLMSLPVMWILNRRGTEVDA